MTLKTALNIVQNVIVNAEQEHVCPVFTTDREIEALSRVADTIEANLDNLSE